MNYEGDIIAESLQNPQLLKTLPVTATRVESVTPEHRTPWLKRWTLHTLSIPPAQAGLLAEQLSHEIETKHHSWYIDFKNNTTHYIVFPDKVFKIDRSQPEQYEAAKAYGVALGIPAHQLINPSGVAPDMT
jgi:hypothetical protein